MYVRRRHKATNKNRLIGIIAVAACIAAVCIISGCNNFEKDAKQKEPAPIFANTFVEGVTVGGIDVSGKTMEQGREALQPLIQEMTQQVEISFSFDENFEEDTINDEGEEETEESSETSQKPSMEYTFPLAELGVDVDMDAPLQLAMDYSKQEFDRAVSFQENPPKNEDGTEQVFEFVPKDFSVEYKWDEATIKTKLSDMQQEYGWRKDPKNKSYKVRTTSDEPTLTTWGEMEETAAKDGMEADVDAMTTTIAGQITTGVYEPFTAPTKVILAAESFEKIPEMQLVGAYTTEFQDSSEGRLYNIWKISDKLNGVVFAPGQEFSVNEHVGPRNEETGWDVAMGIEDGQYTPQYGGGICQVSSTMYNATLYAELRPTARRPHTIMAKYTPPGRDATISTGSPDFKVVNDDPRNLYMIVKCDVPSREVRVEIWGTIERDYKVKISSELVSTESVSEVEYVTDSSLGPYEYKTVIKGQQGEYYDIYRTRIYSDGREEKEKISSSSYYPKGAIYALGAGIPLPDNGTPFEKVKALAARLKAEAENAPPTETEPPAETIPPEETPPAE